MSKTKHDYTLINNNNFLKNSHISNIVSKENINGLIKLIQNNKSWKSPEWTQLVLQIVEKKSKNLINTLSTTKSNIFSKLKYKDLYQLLLIDSLNNNNILEPFIKKYQAKNFYQFKKLAAELAHAGQMHLLVQNNIKITNIKQSSALFKAIIKNPSDDYNIAISTITLNQKASLEILIDDIIQSKLEPTILSKYTKVKDPNALEILGKAIDANLFTNIPQTLAEDFVINGRIDMITVLYKTGILTTLSDRYSQNIIAHLVNNYEHRKINDEYIKNHKDSPDLVLTLTISKLIDHGILTPLKGNEAKRFILSIIEKCKDFPNIMLDFINHGILQLEKNDWQSIFNKVLIVDENPFSQGQQSSFLTFAKIHIQYFEELYHTTFNEALTHENSIKSFVTHNKKLPINWNMQLDNDEETIYEHFNEYQRNTRYPDLLGKAIKYQPNHDLLKKYEAGLRTLYYKYVLPISESTLGKLLPSSIIVETSSFCSINKNTLIKATRIRDDITFKYSYYLASVEASSTSYLGYYSELLKSAIIRYIFKSSSDELSWNTINTLAKKHDIDIHDKSIRQIYHKIALKVHPDKVGGSNNEFIKLNNAIKSISNPNDVDWSRTGEYLHNKLHSIGEYLHNKLQSKYILNYIKGGQVVRTIVTADEALENPTWNNIWNVAINSFNTIKEFTNNYLMTKLASSLNIINIGKNLYDQDYIAMAINLPLTIFTVLQPISKESQSPVVKTSLIVAHTVSNAALAVIAPLHYYDGYLLVKKYADKLGMFSFLYNQIKTEENINDSSEILSNSTHSILTDQEEVCVTGECLNDTNSNSDI